jgi:ribonuclease HI
MRELRSDPRAVVNRVLRLYTDGAARGNPGPAGLGISIEDDQGNKLSTKHKWLGVATNNQAEYRALIEGLKAVREWKPERLEVRLDSNLVVQQIKGGFRVKEPELKKLHEEARALLEAFAEWDIKHVDREHNKRADYLANLAIDEHGKG